MLHFFRLYGSLQVVIICLGVVRASVAQSVEHPLGKGEVSGSSPPGSSKKTAQLVVWFLVEVFYLCYFSMEATYLLKLRN